MSAAMGNERAAGAGRLGQEYERAKENISGAAAAAKENLGEDFSSLRAEAGPRRLLRPPLEGVEISRGIGFRGCWLTQQPTEVDEV